MDELQRTILQFDADASGVVDAARQASESIRSQTEAVQALAAAEQEAATAAERAQSMRERVAQMTQGEVTTLEELQKAQQESEALDQLAARSGRCPGSENGIR